MTADPVRLDFVRHGEDRGFDQIVLVSNGLPVIRCTTHYRFKTSGLSGDEWRTSVNWQTKLALLGELQEDHREPEWKTYDGSYHELSDAAAAFYPGIYSSQKPFHGLKIDHVDFTRKGEVRYRATHDGEAAALLVIAGHMPYALTHAGESGVPLIADPKFCFQIGCSEPAVSTYGLKQRWRCNMNHPEPATNSFGGRISRDARRFCQMHMRRGDCGFDDADANYEVLEGPGPDQAVGWEKYRRESIRGPTIVVPR